MPYGLSKLPCPWKLPQVCNQCNGGLFLQRMIRKRFTQRDIRGYLCCPLRVLVGGCDSVAVHVHRALIGTNVLINQIHFPVSWPEAYHTHLNLSLNVHLLSHLSISNPTLPPQRPKADPETACDLNTKHTHSYRMRGNFPPTDSYKGDGGIDKGKALDQVSDREIIRNKMKEFR